jgi:hypothetical protein
MSLIKWLLVSVIASLLAACGGGNAGTPLLGTGSGSGLGGGGTTTTSGLSLTLSISSTTATSAAPATVTATLHSATGAQVSGQVITFSTAGGLGSFSVSSALTNSSGQAVVQLFPASASANGADLVVAKSTVNTTAVSGTIGFQVTPGSGGTTPGAPSITLSLSSSAVTETVHATLTGVVRDATGAPIGGQVVTFSTASTGIGAFSPTSALSDSTGTITTQLVPASTTSNGADTAIAQTTVAGVLATGSVGFSVTSAGPGSGGTPSISLSLSTSTVTTATPATVTAVVRDATNAGVVGQVVNFSTVNGLGALAVTSALTDATGSASTTLTATTATQSGADQVLASTTVNGTALQASQGFQLTASSVSIANVTSDVASLSAYGQTNVLVTLAGTIPGTPVTVSITSACIASGKATLTPTSATTTSGLASFTYHDAGCGATSTTDTLNASITGSAATGSVVLTIALPTANSINFVSATPTSIFLKGSGYTESSTILFKVLDTAGNGLPGQSVLLHATTLAGGLTLDGAQSDETKISDSGGQVSVLINSGTVPTPVRVSATLVAQPSITTVSSSLSIAVGLPSQLNFSLSQATRNIEGLDIDGVKNTYMIIASDRLGNPVPAGTSINFITESGQIAQSAQTTIDANGNATASVAYLSSEPRPTDGRVTVLAYALGEESFIDLNGTNVFASNDPFQDLGNIYLDRSFNGVYNSNDDQFISTSLSGSSSACAAIPPAYQTLLGLDVSIPSIPNTCDGVWGKQYVRRAIETVLSTSGATPHWDSSAPNGGTWLAGAEQGGSCPAKDVLTVGYDAAESPIVNSYYPVLGTALTDPSRSYSILVSDANVNRLNPMAAGTLISIAATTGVTGTLLGGSPVPNTSDVSFASFSYAFSAPTTSGTVTLTFTSPGGLATSIGIPVFATASGATICP